MFPEQVGVEYCGYVVLDQTGEITVGDLTFKPNLIEFKATPPVDDIDVDKASGTNTNTPDCYAGTSWGYAKNVSGGIENVGMHSGGTANSINASSMYSSSQYSIVVRYAGQDGAATGYVKAYVSKLFKGGFKITVDVLDRNLLVLWRVAY